MFEKIYLQPYLRLYDLRFTFPIRSKGFNKFKEVFCLPNSLHLIKKFPIQHFQKQVNILKKRISKNGRGSILIKSLYKKRTDIHQYNPIVYHPLV